MARSEERALTSLLTEMAIPNYEYRSEFAREHIEKGAVQAAAHAFEHRLGRALTDEERATLATRIREQGIERVAELVLDLSVEELVNWLAPKNGH